MAQLTALAIFAAVFAVALNGLPSVLMPIVRVSKLHVSAFSIVQTLPNLPAGWLSIELGTRGPLLSECTACAASNMAIGDGCDAIRLGRADVMLCGGTEAAVCEGGIAGFGAMRALSARARRVVWLNPLAGDRRYEPTARAMAAALPYVDHLLPAHNLESLTRLLPLLAA